MQADRAALWIAAAWLVLAVPPATERFEPCESPVMVAPGSDGPARVVCEAPPTSGRLRGAPRLLFGEPLDPNTTSAEALQVLPGIGPGRARAIVAARRERPFTRVADLARVHGIGPRTLERIASQLRVEPADRSADP